MEELLRVLLLASSKTTDEEVFQNIAGSKCSPAGTISVRVAAMVALEGHGEPAGSCELLKAPI